MRYSCPDCQDTGRFVERPRLPGDRHVNVACNCRLRDTQAHEDLMAAERAAQEEADRLMRQPFQQEDAGQNTIKKPTTASEGVKMLAGSIARLAQEVAS